MRAQHFNKRSVAGAVVFGLAGSLWATAGLTLVPSRSPEAPRGDDAQPALGFQQAQPQSGAGPDRLAAATGVPTLSVHDRRFLQQAIEGGLAEVRAATLAQRQAASPDVRRAAQQLAQQHSLANHELERIASANGVVPPKEPTDHHRGQYSRLRSLSGATFDKEFLREQIGAHTRTIQLYQRAQAQSTNRTIKVFAATMLPKLKSHLSMLKIAQEKGQAGTNPRQGGTPVTPE